MIDFIYSDPHFGHKKLAKIRGFVDKATGEGDPEQMDVALIDNYNRVVYPSDTCLWIGDAFLMSYFVAETIMLRLNGTKYLVLGNHDRNAARMAKLGFSLVCEELVLSICGRAVRACHYPHWDPNRKLDRRHFDSLSPERVEELKSRYPKRRKGELLIHGHIHGTERVYQNMINASCDAWDLKPIAWNRIEELVKQM